MQPTRVCAEVASERVSPAAGIVAEGALEGLLPGVQLDVTQQVALLGEGGTALVAVEGPFPCEVGLRPGPVLPEGAGAPPTRGGRCASAVSRTLEVGP